MATLAEDCMYTVVNKGVDWHGKAGATQFYTQLLTSFPDIHFDLQNIVIGPQWAFEESHVTGTYEVQWLDLPAPAGQHVEFFVTSCFPGTPIKNFSAASESIFTSISLLSRFLFC
jgi:hypothetical protein